MWEFRPARPTDAAEACAAVRASIIELCTADHDGDPAILGPWLANKTPEQVQGWIGGNPDGFLVGVLPDGGPGRIGGVGAVMPDGRIAMNYVAPWARFQGVSKGLMRAMERRAAALGHAACTLTSTVTAHGFYRAYGYRDDGPPIASFGGKPAYPMRRAITLG